MNRVIWRLHRNQALFAAIGLAAATPVIVISGLSVAHAYHLLRTCAATASCAAVPYISEGNGLVNRLVAASILVLPGLLALFWGVPLVAKELEEGTHVLAWTQSVTRRRWIMTNIGWALLAAATLGAVMSGLVTWWRTPTNDLYGRLGQAFDIQGFVPVAYCVFGVALGIAAGVLLKRVLPALALTLGALVVARGAVAIYLRSHLLAPVSFTARGTPDLSPQFTRYPTLARAWLLSERVVNASGTTVPRGWVPRACSSVTKGMVGDSGCMAAHGYKTVFVYQPDSRFWSLQAMESLLFLALAILVLGLAYRALSRRDA